MRFHAITSEAQMEALILELGIIPLIRCDIPGFSIEDCTPPSYWFEGNNGPWEWKEGIVARRQVVYGKLLCGKSVFMSREWYHHLTAYRRNGYDFEGYYEDGFASRRAKDIIDLLTEKGPLLSSDVKRTLGYRKNGLKGFDSVIGWLQMQTYVAIDSFDYKRDKQGMPYGWGISRYDLSEKILGVDSLGSQESSAQAGTLLAAQLSRLLPDLSHQQIARLLR